MIIKLNVIASDSGIFPRGFGDLIYDNHKKLDNPTNPIFDGKTVREIMDQVDNFLACNENPKDVTADEYYQIKKINVAFN